MLSSKRGCYLTSTGLKKVEMARENLSPKLSWEEISFLGCLHRTTVSKVINGMVVDLRSIKKLFMAVSINLSNEDYCLRQSDQKPTLALASPTMTSQDKELLIKVAEDLEKIAENESEKERKEALLDRVKNLRSRAAELTN